ncbi:MAG: hypothetical protein R3F59_22885 [Myxococcota bacterium]
MSGAVLALIVSLWGCRSTPDCTDPSASVVEVDGRALQCEQANEVVDYIELLAGRRLLQGDRPAAMRALRDKFQADPEGTLAWIGQVKAAGAALAPQYGLHAAEARAEAVWTAQHGDGLVRPSDEALFKVQKRALGVWSHDDATKLAVTESDLEAWIHYASLCREAQGGGVLRISVADRVTVYKDLIARFDEGQRPNQIALASMGPVWLQVQDAWQSASYERQQRWIAAAPLPPPMTATSLGYAEAVFEGNLWQHASVLHDVLGPFLVGRPEDFGVEAQPPPPPPPPAPEPAEDGDGQGADGPHADGGPGDGDEAAPAPAPAPEGDEGASG